MLGDEHPDGLTRCSIVSSRQTRIFGKLSAVSAVAAAAAELVSSEPKSIENEPVNAERQRSRGQVKRGQVSKISVILETNEPGRRVE